jgi:hypothetical protein
MFYPDSSRLLPQRRIATSYWGLPSYGLLDAFDQPKYEPKDSY